MCKYRYSSVHSFYTIDKQKGNANAAGENTDGSYDVGLWQINDYNWNSCSGGKAPCDPSTNLNCAKKVYAWGGIISLF